MLPTVNEPPPVDDLKSKPDPEVGTKFVVLTVRSPPVITPVFILPPSIVVVDALTLVLKELPVFSTALVVDYRWW